MQRKTFQRNALSLAVGATLALTAAAQDTTQEQQPAGQQQIVPAEQIELKQDEPVVNIEQGEPQIKIEKAEPVVTVNQAEPKLDVQQDEPELQIEQGQEPQLVIDQANPLYNLRVNDFEDYDVYNLNGEEVGEVEELVVDPQAKKLMAVLEVGGFLGLGEKEILVDFSELQLQNDRLVLNTAASEEELENRPEYEENRYVEVSDDLDVTLGELQASDFAQFEAK